MRFRPLGLLLGLGAMLLAGCDSSSAPPEDAVALTVLSSSDPDGPFTDTLGVFEAGWGSPFSLDQAQWLRYRVPESGGFGIEAFHGEAEEGDGVRTEVYVFMARRFGDGAPGVHVTDWRARERPASSADGSGSSARVTPAHTERAGERPFIDFRLFFVEGVGEPPTEPVEVTFYPLDENHQPLPTAFSVWVDPERHTLRAPPVLTVQRQDLPLGTGEGPYVGYRVEYEAEGDLQPLLVSRNSLDRQWDATSNSDGAFSAGRYHGRIEEGFELRLFTLDAGELRRNDGGA